MTEHAADPAHPGPTPDARPDTETVAHQRSMPVRYGLLWLGVLVCSLLTVPVAGFLGTDAGKIIILEYSAAKQCFERVHAETYGKTGVRRIVPGQYVAADPRGRAMMVGAVEKQKLVYILNRDTAARLLPVGPRRARPLQLGRWRQRRGE